MGLHGSYEYHKDSKKKRGITQRLKVFYKSYRDYMKITRITLGFLKVTVITKYEWD